MLEGMSLRVCISELKYHLAGCGCLIPEVTIHGPSMVYAVHCPGSPHPTFTIECKEVSPFPMEWFYRPLIDASLVRQLVVGTLRLELHFSGDEAHCLLSVQMPRVSAVMLRILKLFSGELLHFARSPLDHDPVTQFQLALGEDARALE